VRKVITLTDMIIGPGFVIPNNPERLLAAPSLFLVLGRGFLACGNIDARRKALLLQPRRPSKYPFSPWRTADVWQWWHVANSSLCSMRARECLDPEAIIHHVAKTVAFPPWALMALRLVQAPTRLRARRKDR
jgi:hypothetical protein